jgi:hypothetical protein
MRAGGVTGAWGPRNLNDMRLSSGVDMKEADVRLATFTESGRTRIGVIEQEEIADLSCEAGLTRGLQHVV